MSKKEQSQKQADEGSGILIPVLIAAAVCVLLTTAFIVVYGLQYTQQQRVIAAQRSVEEPRSLPSEEPVQSSTPPVETPTETEPQEESAPDETSPSVSPSATPSVTPAGNDRDSKFANGMVLATTESDNEGDPVYHTSNCRAAVKIDAGSELWYESAQAAERDNRRICGNCD